MSSSPEQGTHSVRNTHVRGGLPRARGHAFTPDSATDLYGLPVVSSPAVPDGKWLLMAGKVLVGEYRGEAHDVITAELVACTLGARRRPELTR